MIEILKTTLSSFEGMDYGELRFHERIATGISIRQGELETLASNIYSGVGVRALYQGGWGFSATSRIEVNEIKRAISDACASAKVASFGKVSKNVKLATAQLAKGKFAPIINDPLTNHTIEEKLDLVKNTESKLRKASKFIQSAKVAYIERLERKFIVTTDGAECEIIDSKPEFIIFAVGVDGKDMVESLEAVGVTGGWQDLFGRKSPDEFIESAIKRIEVLLKAGYPKGERTTVILDPGLVGLIAHEAIGHTVEADFVSAGAITKDKIGQRVASDLVTLFDSGPEGTAGGTILVDDEGVIAKKVVIIQNGILKSYLHNRQSAGEYGCEPTGNARAYEYSDEPIIRMRNTGVMPGNLSLAEIIDSTQNGYLLKGAKGGQADANAEFMFGVQEAYRITKGKIGECYRGVTISGQAFDVLMSVDAVSQDFQWDMGFGHCGKWQPAKVDGGGPYLRCQAIIGGRQ
ncbi:MAG: TldD/PmbA family protein [candidate division WOR-3 bacterium]|nr:TldD/PmbA family protein [candidate division WOR-3 bacterium]